MDFLTGKIRNLFFRYLAAAFGSALITSIYSIVDMAMVGQYHGPEGSAALAVVAPVWNIIYSLGLLTGIGGSVLFSIARGKAESRDTSNEYFTASVIGSVVLGVLVWILIIFFDRDLLLLFGAEGNTLAIAREYVAPIKFAVPLFLFNQMLAAYLRNDKNPALATGGVLAGGVFNIFGDYFFVFTCDMGACGAGLATAIGSFISFVVMLSHFLLKKNIPGDMDEDGQVTITDVMQACRVLARKNSGEQPTPEEIRIGDLDGDGDVTIADVMEICKILARGTNGTDAHLPLGR